MSPKCTKRAYCAMANLLESKFLENLELSSHTHTHTHTPIIQHVSLFQVDYLVFSGWVCTDFAYKTCLYQNWAAHMMRLSRYQQAYSVKQNIVIMPLLRAH